MMQHHPHLSHLPSFLFHLRLPARGDLSTLSFALSHRAILSQSCGFRRRLSELAPGILTEHIRVSGMGGLRASLLSSPPPLLPLRKLD